MSHFLRFLWGMENMDYYKKKNGAVIGVRGLKFKNIKNTVDICVFYILCGTL